MSTLSCSEIRERILDGDEDAALRAHVAGCAECAPILAAMDGLDADLEALPKLDAPDALVEATLARVREESAEPAPVTVSSPSLLAAAFAVLTSAIGALVTAPLVALHWLLGVGSQRAKEPSTPASLDDRGKSSRRPRFMTAPVFAFASVLLCVIAFTTFQTLGSTVKTKVRGAESIVSGLPMTTDEEEAPADGWWSRNEDAPAAAAAAATPRLPAREAPAEPSAAPDPQMVAQLNGLGYAQGDIDGRFELPADSLVAEDVPNLETTEHHGAGYGVAAPSGGPGASALAQTGTFALDRQQQTGEGRGDIGGEIALTPELPAQPAAPHVSAERAIDDLLEANQTIERPRPPAATDQTSLRGARLDDAEDETRERGRQLDLGTEGGDGDDGVVYRAPVGGRLATPSYWDLAQATSGLTFASSQSWWANTYVPGDARLRVLHARLAAAPATLTGSTMSALALAELASPTTPAVGAPTDRALALGVHADTTAIEGPTRVRMEIALRAIDQAAGRRGALRIALVVDARGGLGTEETAHLRALLASLSRSLSPRDRVILTAAGAGGGTLVPLGVLRHGQVEVALRHLADTSLSAGEAIPVSLDAALASGLEAVTTDDDGAGLALLVTASGAHDAAVDQALHLGAVAGVPTTAVGIGSGASTASLDAIALAGEGRRRVVLGDEDAARAVREELTAASRLVARALRVRVRLADGVSLVDVVGSHALDTEETRRTRESERAIDQSLARRLGIVQDRDEDDSGVRILVPSFYAGDSHTIVLDLLVTRPGPVADVDVRFKDLVRLGNGTASSALALEAGTEPRGPHELRVVASYLGHEVAGALDEAATALDRGDLATARATLTRVRALIDQARASVTGLGSVPSMNADALLCDRFLEAITSATDPALVASSLHYAAARRVVVPQLQASTP